jgi:hypothetical protein
MRLPTRAALASSIRFAIGLVTLAVLLVGSSATAAADPSGSPTSTALPAASPTPSTATPTPTPTATASATATSSATTPGITPTSASSPVEPDSPRPAGVRAAKVPVTAGAGIARLQARLPARLRRFGALATTTRQSAKTQQDATTQQDARVAAAAPGLEDDRLAISVISRCAEGSATSADVAVLLLADAQLSVSYVVRDDGNAHVAQGSFTLVPDSDLDFADFTVADLTMGGYHLDLFAGDVETPTSSLDFDVIGCVTATVTCQAITFSNPASNPALELNVSGDDPDGGSSDATLALASGDTRTVRTGRTTIDWFAGTGVATELSQIIALAGAAAGTAIPQGCADPSSSVRVGCAGGGSAKVTLSVDHFADETVEWVILDAFRTEVASGRVNANGRTLDRFSALLPGVGRYEYLLYVSGTGDVLESFDFAVRACRAGLADTGAPSGAAGALVAALLLIATGVGLCRLFRPTRIR